MPIPDQPTELDCPICGKHNQCQLAQGSGSCWCMQLEQAISAEVKAQVPLPLQGRRCICQNCIETTNFYAG